MNKAFKIFRIVILAVLGILILSIFLLYISFHNEISTILSVRKINDKPAYTLTYHGDYKLNQYLETGSKDYNELINFLNKSLAHGAGNYVYDVIGCSAFFAKTPEGDYILARNLDTENAIPAVIRTDSKQGNKTIGMVNLINGGWSEGNPISKLSVISSPYFTLDGVNEYGLAVASMTIPVKAKLPDDGKKTIIHDLTVDRIVLDKAKSVEDAIELLSKYYVKMEKKYPSHYLIADAEGNSAVIEYVDGVVQVIDGTGSYQIATNFPLYDNKTLTGYSSERYHRFEKELSQSEGIISEEEALDLLEANIVPGEGQWSVVYNLTKKEMTVEFYNDYETTYSYNMKY